MTNPSGTKTFLRRAAASILARYVRFVGRTSTVYADPETFAEIAEAHQPVIYAFWHGQFLLIPHIRPKSVPTAVMVARHRDAEILTTVLEGFDLELIRGAGAGTRRRDRGGATALRASIATLKEGTSIAMTADIPPGPARRAGEGIVALARLSGRPIVPGAVASSRFQVLPSWSHLTVNLPFSRIGVAMGEPIHVPPGADGDERETVRQALEAQLNQLTERAYEIAGAAQRTDAPLTGQPVPSGWGARLYKAGTRLLEPIGPTLLKRRARRGKEDLSRQNERLGWPKAVRPHGRLVWFHAASVGELNSIHPLLREIKAQHPDLALLVTTGTATSAQVAREKLADVAVHQFIPLDGPRMVRRFLDHWKPDTAFFVESEIWPNLIYAASERSIRLVLLNARLSDRSMKSWRGLLWQRTAASLFTRFSLILAQSDQDLLRFCRFGVTQIENVGNLKIDAPEIAVDAAQLAPLKTQIGGRPVFIAASTHPGEEAVIAKAHGLIKAQVPDVLTIIVPRHPERGAAVADEIGEHGWRTAQRSAGMAISQDVEIYIADTIGELGLFYSLANAAFMGGSLIVHGGQNPLEPIRLHVPVLSGPHTFNFAEIYRALRQSDGFIAVSDGEELAQNVVMLLNEPERVSTMVSNAVDALGRLEGAVERTLERIEPFLAGDQTAETHAHSGGNQDAA